MAYAGLKFQIETYKKNNINNANKVNIKDCRPFEEDLEEEEEDDDDTVLSETQEQ
jgi:hypothetical protein